MPEKMGEEIIAEQLEDKTYDAVQEAEKEVRRILGEMDKIFETISDRREAEKVILETLAPQMDEALAVSRKAFDAWISKEI